MRLTDLLSTAGLSCSSEYTDVEITGITCDTRRIREGNLFVALKGRKTDAHALIEEAILRGAAAVLTEEGSEFAENVRSVPILSCGDTRSAMAYLADAYYGFPSRELKIVGVTGTNGKTTVARLLSEILLRDGQKIGLIGTTGAFVGAVALNAEGISPDAHMTTPDPEVFYRILAEMRDMGCRMVVMEATSHASALKKLSPIRFSLLIFTNLTRDHLDFHGTMEAYYDAKAALFRRTDRAIVNLDGSGVIGDPVGYGAGIAEEGRRSGAKVTTLSADPKRSANVSILDVEMHRDAGISFTLLMQDDEMRISSPLVGRFNVMNLAEAATAARMLGVKADTICTALRSFFEVKGRMERVTAKSDDISVFIDFAHTPDALENLLFTMRELREKGSRILLLFGCGGDRDRTKRKEMAQIASRMADVVYITEDNRRSEDIGQIFSDILQGMDKEKPYFLIERREDAIAKAIMDAAPGDIVLLCGKGHEQYTVDQNGTHEFFEDKIARQALLSRRSDGGGHRDEN